MWLRRAALSARVGLTRSEYRAFSTAQRTPHSILGIEPGETSQALIKAAYKQKALEHHPDRHAAEDRDAAEREFKMVSEAYGRLSGTVGRPRSFDNLTAEEAEEIFWETFGADGDIELALNPNEIWSAWPKVQKPTKPAT